jgi:hypothetical protein
MTVVSNYAGELDETLLTIDQRARLEQHLVEMLNLISPPEQVALLFKDDVDSWEERIDELEQGPHEVKIDTDIDLELAKGATVSHNEEVFEFTEQNCHPVLAASRRVVDSHLRMKAVTYASSIKKECKAVAFEIGAQYNGLAAMSEIFRRRKYNGVYLHCTMPEMSNPDRARQAAARDSLKSWPNLNWVDRTLRVTPDKINVCAHSAKECTCMQYYDKVYAFSIHCAYYFEYDDWDNLMNRYRDRLVRFDFCTHVPDEGRQVPASGDGEIEWCQVEDSGLPVYQKLALKYKEWFTGEKYIVMEPSRTMGTRYVHKDPRQMIDTGGMHFSASIAAASRPMPWSEVALVAGSSALTAMTMATSVVTWKQRLALAAMSAACGLVGYNLGRAVHRRSHRSSALPEWWARYHRVSSLALTPHKVWRYRGEEIVSTYTIRPNRDGKYFPLEPQLTRSPNINGDHLPDVTAAMVLTEDSASSSNLIATKTGRTAAGMLLRRGVTIDSVRDTLVRARQSVRFLGRSQISRPRWLCTSGEDGNRQRLSVLAKSTIEILFSIAVFLPPLRGYVASVLGPWLIIADVLLLLTMVASALMAMRALIRP